jgi:hypothetical protein
MVLEFEKWQNFIWSTDIKNCSNLFTAIKVLLIICITLDFSSNALFSSPDF